MAYTKEQNQIYRDIKQEEIENGETPEHAETIAREILYNTRRAEKGLWGMRVK